jgi:hypothetical protein
MYTFTAPKLTYDTAVYGYQVRKVQVSEECVFTLTFIMVPTIKRFYKMLQSILLLEAQGVRAVGNRSLKEYQLLCGFLKLISYVLIAGFRSKILDG